MRRESQERFPDLSAELVRLKVDIIVAAGGATTNQAAKECDRYDSHCYDGRAIYDPVEAMGSLPALRVLAGISPALSNLGTETKRKAAGAAERERFPSSPAWRFSTTSTNPYPIYLR